jgi:hypothetical protein
MWHNALLTIRIGFYAISRKILQDIERKKLCLLYNWHLENLGTKKGLYLLDMRHLILTFVANPILILISYKKYF